MKKHIGAAAILFAAALTAGCATTAGTAAPQAGDSLRLPDTVKGVTQDMYEASFAAFEQCMTDSDASIFGVETIADVHYYSYMTDRQPAYDKCYSLFEAVDVAWQLVNEYNNPTQVSLRECLEAAGVTPEKTVEGVWAQLQTSKIDPVVCTSPF